MPTAALIMGGASLAGSIGSSLIGANAAQQASSQQVAEQQAVLNMLQQTIGPLISQGQGIAGSVLPTLQKLLTPGPSQTATLSQLPGFQFAQQWGQSAVQNLGTTTGLGGNVLTAGANYATGLAQQNFQNYITPLQSLLTSGLNLEGSAAGALAGGSQSALTGIGNAQAAGTLGSANAISSGITGATSGLGNAALLYTLGNKFGLGSTNPAAQGLGGAYSNETNTILNSGGG